MKLLEKFFGPKISLNLTELKSRKYNYEQLDKYSTKFFKSNPKLVVENNWVPTITAFRKLNSGKAANSESYACIFNYALNCDEKYILAVYSKNWNNKLIGVAACVFRADKKYKITINGKLYKQEFDSIPAICYFIQPVWVKAYVYKETQQGYYKKISINKFI